MENQEYIPGTCNIGVEERNMRKRTGWTGLFLTIILLIAFIIIKPNTFTKALIFFPAFMASIGLLQGYLKFCAYFGFFSLFNFNELGKEKKIESSDFRNADRKKAIRIVLIASLISILFTSFIVLLLPSHI
jgi:hypothetical protein